MSALISSGAAKWVLLIGRTHCRMSEWTAIDTTAKRTHSRPKDRGRCRCRGMGAQDTAHRIAGRFLQSLAATRLGLAGRSLQGSAAHVGLVSFLLDTNVVFGGTRPRP